MNLCKLSDKEVRDAFDRISILTDTDGDGVMDKKTVFADYAHGVPGGLPVQNSCVTLLMPIDSSTIFPPASGAPAASSGTIACAAATAAARCTHGGTLLLGYSPPAWVDR